jgi:hypothetical protein
MRADEALAALGTAAFERIGLRVDPDEFQRLVEEAIERVVPIRRSTAPREELSVEEVRVLEEGGYRSSRACRASTRR